jgi:uncharacterized phage protein (TIGR02218 family)
MLFTTHDRNLVIDNETYLAAYSFEPTAIETTATLDPNNAELKSIYSDQITPAFVLGGGLRNAKIIHLQGVDWRSLPPTIEAHPFKEVGQVGKVTGKGRTAFTVENRTRISAALAGGSVLKTSPVCLHNFCDQPRVVMGGGCGLNIAPYTHAATITSVSNQASFHITDTADHTYGYIEFTSGENTGCRFAIATGVNGDIELAETPEGEVKVGDTVTAVMGCAKTPTACKTYGNFLNFMGIPTGGNWMPGMDQYQNAPIVRA